MQTWMEQWEDESLDDSTRFMAIANHSFAARFINPDSVITLCSRLAEQAEEAGRIDAQCAFLVNIAECHAVLGHQDLRSQFAMQARDLAEEFEYYNAVANYHANEGVHHMSNGRLNEAIQELKKSEEIRRQHGEPEDHNALHNIGQCYAQIEDMDQFFIYTRKSQAIREELGDSIGMTYTYLNLGSAFSKTNRDSAIKYLELAMDIGPRWGLERVAAVSALNYGELLIEEGNLEAAAEKIEFCSTYAKRFSDPFVGTYATLAVGVLACESGDYLKAIETCDSINWQGNVDFFTLRCDCLIEGYKGISDFASALDLLEQKDSVLNQGEAVRSAQGLQEYEAEKQALLDSIAVAEEMALMTEEHGVSLGEKESQRNIFIGIGVIVALIAGFIFFRLRRTRKAKAASDEILHNVLPSEIADEIKQKGGADARNFDQATILFSDFKGFTALSEQLGADELVKEIDICFKAFDLIMEKHKVEKIKTIGDAYMAAGGIPDSTVGKPADVVNAALDIQEFMINRKRELASQGRPGFDMRVGVHTGPVVAGIVGAKKFQYDVWGDTVNVASRMESSGEIEQVNISDDTYRILSSDSRFSFEPRGMIEAKGKGEMEMFFVFRSIE